MQVVSHDRDQTRTLTRFGWTALATLVGVCVLQISLVVHAQVGVAATPLAGGSSVWTNPGNANQSSVPGRDAVIRPARDLLKPSAKPTPKPRPTAGPGSGCKIGVASGNLCVGVRPIPTPWGPRPQPFALPREPERPLFPGFPKSRSGPEIK